MICREIANGGTENVEDIPHTHEQQYFLLLKKLLPTAKIVYEASKFEIADGNRVNCTIPDFHIELANGKKAIVEITTALKYNITKKEQDDPKKNQKKVMGLAAPGIKYVVLYGENLANLQRRNPWVDFFNAKKIRGNGL